MPDASLREICRLTKSVLKNVDEVPGKVGKSGEASQFCPHCDVKLTTDFHKPDCAWVRLKRALAGGGDDD